MFEVNNKDTRTTPWRRSGVFIVNLEHISHFVLVFLLLTLNMKLLAGWVAVGIIRGHEFHTEYKYFKHTCKLVTSQQNPCANNMLRGK